MVRTVRRYFRIVPLETASIFCVDGCIYIHAESEFFYARHESLKDWIGSNPGLKNRLACIDRCFEDQADHVCETCRRDQQVCNCEIDANGLVWGPFGVRCDRDDEDFPF